ncbi:MAG: UDP-N-acetylmuramoyl-L-alanyl-D-glutamate--2,6-diaminopimelate ligase [Chthonomonadales bacterium]|nr:UDP-N-acetylmuramoyl-L-alanyl-D-glutamate--2,6-diaminopimelate ligase [Chthonomonadales bacterium]
MTLLDLATALGTSAVIGSSNIRVTGVSHDSRTVAEGDLFACLVGATADGHEFIREAVARGARAVLVNKDRRDAIPSAVSAIVVPDTRVALGPAAACVFGYPSHDVDVIGVTGTNGKSTTVAMCEAIGLAAGRATGRIGTLGAHAMGRDLPAAHTTPEADDLQRLLAAMRGMGVRLVAMEVSSHGLALRRTDGMRFAGAVFTNLTQDHLDFHGTMDAYLEAKLRLFVEYPRLWETPFYAAINMDDPQGALVARSTVGHVIGFGLGPGAAVRASDVDMRADRTRFVLVSPQGSVQVELPIGGAFQVMNALGASAIMLALGTPLEAVAEGLHAMKPVPGRFESVQTGRDWSLIVDFAHTPDGLASLLKSARALNPSRIILVMGCGGNRDAGKRPIMGRIGAEGADVLVVTSDNPRHEDPAAIIKQILAGVPEGICSLHAEVDRRLAIEYAIREARSGDLVLLAGKGGETYMIVGDEHIPYDDREVAREIIERLP